MNAALAVIAEGRPATDALRAAGVDGVAVWLEPRADAFDYAVVPDPGVRLDAEIATEIARRALRRGERGLHGMLSDGSRIQITPPVRPEARRMAVLCSGRLSRFEINLTAVMAERCRLVGGSPTAADHTEEAPSTPGRLVDQSPAALIIDLGAFEDVRLTAGQLSAERVTADAWARLQALLRQEGLLIRLDEDRFVVVLEQADRTQLDAVERRIADTLAQVPVPRRASRIQPTIRYVSGAELDSEPGLGRLGGQAGPRSTPRKAA